MNIDALKAAGFKDDAKLHAAHEEQATENKMHDGGPYVVHGVMKKGSVTVLFEQNTAPEEIGGGMKAVISHPAVCVVSGPNGRAACNPDDTELILHLAEQLS